MGQRILPLQRVCRGQVDDGLLDLNDAESVRNGLDQTREELRLQTRGIWPSRSMVPEHQRPSYRETLVAQAHYLERRLARLAEVKSE